MGRRRFARGPGGLLALAIVFGAGCGGSGWENYLEDHAVNAERRRPGDALEVLALVQAAAAEGRRIRAVGSGHSSSEVAQPSAGHDFVDVGDLDGEMPWSFYRTHPERYVRIGAGTTIEEINAHLATRTPPRALFNMGNYDQQTIAGAFSTGTHGSGFDHGPLTERIVAIELVTDEAHPVTGERVQRLLRLEPENGITDAASFATGHGSFGDAGDPVRVMMLEQGDEAFDAALINLGCFGIIVAVTVETRPPFWLQEEEELRIWDPDALPDLAALAEENREFLQLTIEPHAMPSDTQGGKVIYLETIRRALPSPGTEPADRPRNREDMGRMLARIFSSGMLENISLSNPDSALRAIEKTFRERAEAPDYASRSDVVLINSLAPEFDATSIDIWVPLDKAAAAIDRIIELARERGTDGDEPLWEEWWHTSPLGIRFVGQSRALIAPSYDGPRVSIEIPLLYDISEGPRARALHNQYRDRMMRELEEELTCDRYGGRPHWGQRNWMTDARAEAMYGERWERWKAQYRRFNPHDTFANAFTDRMGLSGDTPSPGCDDADTSGDEVEEGGDA
ncbi:MAG: hypothetical protein DRJ42_19825 [Deltaproteobacteria bacterium]|nr:MAG: hypothetical protein DRJ42_19825 [Deltaproteobacteria bacterium]